MHKAEGIFHIRKRKIERRTGIGSIFMIVFLEWLKINVQGGFVFCFSDSNLENEFFISLSLEISIVFSILTLLTY